MKKVETIAIAKQQSYNLTALGVVLTFIAVALFQNVFGQTNQDFSVWAFLLTFIVTILAHEALHGVGFMLSGAKPRFGVSIVGIMPVAFATSSDRLPLKKMLVVAYLPFIVLSLLFIVLSFSFPTYQPLFMVGFVGNFAGAIGDIWIASKLFKYLKYKDAYILDTKTGTEVYSNSVDAHKIGQQSQEKINKPSSFGKVAAISFVLILTIQLVVPIVLAIIGYDGKFVLGSDKFYLLMIDQTVDNATMQLNLSAPLIGGLLAGLIYRLVERNNHK